MAEDRRGVVQWIRLKVSPQSKQNLKEEAKQTARDAFTDPFGQALGDIGQQVERKVEPALDKVEGAGKRAARGVQNAFRRAGDGIRGFFSSLNNDITRTFAAFFAASAIKGFIQDMWELGSAAGETADKFRITFGAAGVEVQAFIDQYGTLFGLNQTMAREMTATAGAIVQGMGASREESARFAQTMVKLAGDMQSFHNQPIERTFGAIKSALAGSWEPLDQFGAVIRQADVDAKAMLMTGKQFPDQLNQWERAQAALTLAIEKQAVVQDNATLTADSAANQARNMSAEFQNFKIEIAQGLLPVFASMLDWVTENKEELKTFARSGLDVVTVAAKFLWGTLNSLVFLLTTPVMFAFATFNGVLADTNGLLADAAELAAKAARFLGMDALAGEAVHFGNQARKRAETFRGRSQSWLSGIASQAGGLVDMKASMGMGGFQMAEGTFTLGGGPEAAAGGGAGAAAGAAAAARAAKEQAAALTQARRRVQLETRELDSIVDEALERAQDNLKGWTETLAVVRETQTFEARNQAAAASIMANDIKEAWAPLEDFMLDLAEGVTAAWQQAFAMIAQEGATVGEIVKGLGRGMAAAFTGALAGLARSKVSENILKAMEALADGISLAAFPLTAPFAAGKFAAATKYGAVAAGWGVLAGGAGALTGGLSGGGAYGRTGDYMVAQQRRTGGGIADDARNRWELHVYPGGFNPKDPVHVQLLGQGVEELASTDSRFDVIQH